MRSAGYESEMCACCSISANQSLTVAALVLIESIKSSIELSIFIGFVCFFLFLIWIRSLRLSNGIRLYSYSFSIISSNCVTFILPETPIPMRLFRLIKEGLYESVIFVCRSICWNHECTVAEEASILTTSSATVFCPFATNVTSKNNIDKSSFGIYLILV